jgi:predicted metal-binding membrane protein
MELPAGVCGATQDDREAGLFLLGCQCEALVAVIVVLGVDDGVEGG